MADLAIFFRGKKMYFGNCSCSLLRRVIAADSTDSMHWNLSEGDQKLANYIHGSTDSKEVARLDHTAGKIEYTAAGLQRHAA